MALEAVAVLLMKRQATRPAKQAVTVGVFCQVRAVQRVQRAAAIMVARVVQRAMLGQLAVALEAVAVGVHLVATQTLTVMHLVAQVVQPYQARL